MVAQQAFNLLILSSNLRRPIFKIMCKPFVLHSEEGLHFFVGEYFNEAFKGRFANHISERMQSKYGLYVSSLEIYHEIRKHPREIGIWSWPCFKLAKRLGMKAAEVDL